MEAPEMLRLERQKERILDEIAAIKSMRRGTLNEVYRKQELRSGEVARRGPFYNITTKAKGNKTVTTAVPKNDLARVQKDVESYRRFRVLCEEYACACESVSLLLGDGS